MKKISTVLFAVLLLVSGCATSVSSTTPAEGSNGVDEFPIVIEHAYGETTITKKPERIASISWGNQDVPLALGVKPVGVSMANYGVVGDDKLLPWTKAKFEELGVTDPVIFDDLDGLDYEAISDTKPDIIIAAYSGITKEEYDLLSEIAPVVPFEKTAYLTTWRDQISTNAKAIGMSAAASDLIKDLERQIATEIEQYPDVKGKSASFMWFDPTDLGTFYIYGDKDPRASFLLDLGMVQAPSISKVLEGSKEFYTTFSSENAADLNDVDIIIFYGDDKSLEILQKDPLIGTIPAIKNGSVVILTDNSPLAASSTPSALSIPYTIKEYAKLLGEAAKKVK